MCAVKIDLSIYLSLKCLIYLLCTTEKIRKKKNITNRQERTVTAHFESCS